MSAMLLDRSANDFAAVAAAEPACADMSSCSLTKPLMRTDKARNESPRLKIIASWASRFERLREVLNL